MIKAIKFQASWCAPCKAYAPVFNRVVADAGIDHEEYDVDEYPDVAETFGVRSIPMTFIVCGDKIVKRYPGVVDYNDLMAGIKKVGQTC